MINLRQRKFTKLAQNIEEKRVERNGNIITIYQMHHPACVTSFLRALQRGLDKGIKSFKIVWAGEIVFPDACVPIAGIIAFYRENYHIEFEFDVPADSYLQRCGFLDPIRPTVAMLDVEQYPFDKVYRYSDSSQVSALTQSYVDCLSRLTECSEGILTGLIWCLSEIMDNVLVHSEAGHGFVMTQYHPERNVVAICVYDSGIGICNSLRKSSHRPRNSMDAISLAIQEGVGDGKGQGNGLYGLYQIVAENNGALTITTGSSSMMLTTSGEIKKFDNLPYISKDFNSTTIDYRLRINKSIDIKKAFASIGGFDGFDIRLDNMLQEDDLVRYDVYSNSQGTATREAGALLRNDIINTLSRMRTAIILDFTGVKTVSSSFIDELIAKLIIKLGPVKFNQSIRIVNMNDSVRFLCERSIYMRIHSEWSTKNLKGSKND